MKKENGLNAVFREGTPFKAFLLTILVTGLSYGLYKGILDNFLAEVVAMGEMDRGVTEFFRELPGIALVLILAAFYMLSAESLYKIGAVIMLVGMAMHAVLPADKVLMTLAICVYSLGEHIQIGMKSSLSLQYANAGCGGAAQGRQKSADQVGTLVGYLAVVAVFSGSGISMAVGPTMVLPWTVGDTSTPLPIRLGRVKMVCFTQLACLSSR
jgi:hypothetical protein